MLLQNLHSDPVGKFRLVAFAEGVSFIILLFIAMPLKYMYGMPMATKIVGMIHGILFIWYVIQLLQIKDEAGFTTKDTVIFFIASLLPFGTFFTDKRLETLENGK
jgi:integral membrane protein